MNSFTKLAVCAAALAGAAVVSAETVKYTKPGMFLNPMRRNVTEANGQIKTQGKTFLIAKEKFTIDPAKKYTVTVKVDGDKAKGAALYVGFQVVDAKGRAYPAINWQGQQQTFTQVVRAAKKGDKVIYVKDGSRWVSHSTFHIALNAKQDNSDVPNTQIVRNPIASKAKQGDVWALTLKEPLKADIAAGTNVRQHADGGYFYSIIRTVPAGKESTFTGTVQGFAKNLSSFNGKQWPINAKKAQLLLLIDWNNANAENTFKDISLTIE
ncbi:MAG: hypothetical protein E7040_07085 [Lentisphaerae bacterium]|nr:hypothetical protein [Lentisphaerota bacterium]